MAELLKEKACNNRGRDWSYAAAIQGIPRIAGAIRKLRERTVEQILQESL